MARTAEGDTLSRFLADLRNRYYPIIPFCMTNGALHHSCCYADGHDNSHQDVRAKAAKNLRTYVEGKHDPIDCYMTTPSLTVLRFCVVVLIGEARDMSSEQFTKYMNDLNKRIFDLVNSTDAHEKMGGIMVIGIPNIELASHSLLDHSWCCYV